MFDYEEQPKQQPVLTSHEVRMTGHKRGKSYYEVSPRPKTEQYTASKTQFKPDQTRKQGKPGEKSHRSRPKSSDGFNHDQLLQSYKGTELLITIVGYDNSMKVKLIDGDRYVLLIQYLSGSFAGKKAIIFKSQIETIDLPGA